MERNSTESRNCPLCGHNSFRETLKMQTVQSGIRVTPDGRVDYDDAGSLETVDGTEEWATRELECEGCRKTFHLVDGILKPSSKKLILTVSDNSDYFEAADYAVIELTAAMLGRIRKLSDTVRSLGVYRISLFDYSCAFMNADYDQEWESGKVPMKEYQGRTECSLLNVADTGFYWSGLYRHTDVRWSTDTVYLTDLDNTDDYDEREEHPSAPPAQEPEVRI